MKRAYLFLFLGFAFLGGAVFWGGKLIAALPKKTSFAGLRVETLPQSQIFLNEKNLGQTPFEGEKILPGEYLLRLLPEETASFSAWERKIKLNPRLLTYVNYLFGATEKDSAGEILTLEKTGSGKGEIVVVSDPDGASVFIDGKEQGAAPKALSGFEKGEHQISISFPGYHARSFTVKTWTGHKLLVSVKLAAVVKEVPPKASESAGLRVRILETPTGWLRVREEPVLSAAELGKVKPGEEYPLLEEGKDWFKIQHEEEKEGWISASYAEKIE